MRIMMKKIPESDYWNYVLPLFTTINITTKAQTDPNRQQNISDWVSQILPWVPKNASVSVGLESEASHSIIS